ncbi:hypothetical protein TWF506_000061 [Arthrobotrys conoides]|uniref:NAD-dependent epimerase/dehydratase domain-containing protein n=1 Tax=Arthrobotrys conoides TaxID=74498 RepID=A0AAN8NKA5_9PEZI
MDELDILDGGSYLSAMDSRLYGGGGIGCYSLRILRQYIYLAACNSFEVELSGEIGLPTNRISSSRPRIPSWLGKYHRQVIKQVINLITSIPSCLYEPSTWIRNSAVIVTGGLGYVGSHVCSRLLCKGYTVLIIDNLTNSFDSVVRDIRLTLEASDMGFLASKKMIHLPIDYGNAISLSQALVSYSRNLQIIGAIHLAASKSVSESLENPGKYYENNVIKMESFLRVLGKHGVHNVIFSSSATVYGSLPSEMASKALNEDMVPIVGPDVPMQGIAKTMAGLTPYGISKVLGEAMIKKFVEGHSRRRGMVFRLFNPVGCDPSGYLKENPRDNHWCGGGIMQMIRKAVVDDTVFQVFGGGGDEGDGSCIRDFVHVGDIARGIVMGFESCLHMEGNGGRCRVYNLASGKGVSVKQLLKEVEETIGLVLKVEKCKKREGDLPISIGDVEKVKKELGWVPEMGVQDLCRDFCRANGIGKDAGEEPVHVSGLIRSISESL